MVKKTLPLVFMFVVSAFLLFATELEDIWHLCRTNNADIRAKEYDLRVSEYNLRKDTDMNGSPYLGIEGTVNYPRDYEDSTRFIPSGYEESLSFKHNINSSATLGITLNNTLSNGYQFYHEDKYQQTTSVSLTLNHSLSPYWIRGEVKDPYSVKLRETVNVNRTDKDSIEKSILFGATECYIKLRYYFRMSQFYKTAIDEYKALIQTLEALGDDISYQFRVDIADYRNSLWNYTLSLSDIEENLESQRKALSDLCNCEIQITTLEALPSSSEMVFGYDPEQDSLTSKINLAKAERSLNLQSNSASLSLSAGATNKSEVSSFSDFKDGLFEDKNWNWYVSVSLDLSPVFSSARKTTDNDYKMAIEKLISEKAALEAQKQNERNQYTSLLQKAYDRMGTAQDMLSFYYEKMTQAKKMYDNDALSEIELKRHTLSYEQIKVAYDSICDEIWLFEWILSNIH